MLVQKRTPDSDPLPGGAPVPTIRQLQGLLRGAQEAHVREDGPPPGRPEGALQGLGARQARI
jgi:hypothetical protein